MNARPNRASATRAILVVTAVLAAVTGLATPAQAHSGNETLITVAATESGSLEVTAIVPVFQWRKALIAEGRGVETVTSVLADQGAVGDYILARVSLADANGEIPLKVASAALGKAVVEIALVADPQQRDLSTLELTWTLVSDVVPAHTALVSVVPWPGLAGDPTQTLIATLSHDSPAVRFSLGDVVVSPRATAFEAGFQHFRHGLDHVFIMLILAIGLAAPWERGRGGSPDERSPRKLLGLAVVTSLAFAAGHSASLALVATTSLALPTSLIEIAIAVTIAVGALHALGAERGLVSPRLGLVPVALIGLIHGFGFAEALDQIGLSGGNLAWAVFAFNAGLEAAQLAALALFIPVLVFVANGKTLRRVILAVVAGVAALWIADRSGLTWVGTHLPIGGFDGNNPEVVAMAIAAVAVAARAWTRVRRRAAPSRAGASVGA